VVIEVDPGGVVDVEAIGGPACDVHRSADIDGVAVDGGSGVQGIEVDAVGVGRAREGRDKGVGSHEHIGAGELLRYVDAAKTAQNRIRREVDDARVLDVDEDAESAA